MTLAIKAVIDWARAIRGCTGVAVYAGAVPLYNYAVDDGYARVLPDLLRASSGAWRASAAAGGFTFVCFYAGEYLVVLKVAGRFPALSAPDLQEPSFVDPSCAPALPSRDEARLEAEAALRQFGLLR
jgi:hypothetical protein